MGVPKFFRYISERYPCLSELVRQNEIPEFDNLYLDMNGIIHNCSHPSDDVHFRLSEEQMFQDIFNYLDLLFKMIKPVKLFFMAVDGVAPRAKMNQQRGRRFRSAKDAERQEKAAREKGELLPKEKRFDSNCITPGTEFMVRLNDALRYFIKLKISTDSQWQHCEVVLSGHETPGEGEHKIMEYIRFLQSKPGYDVKTRHCLYGLDADLVMLGLCTHQKHFSLLREEVKFGKNSRAPSSIHAIKFFLLHLSLFRDYLELEFSPIKDKLTFEFNIENIIDDWILMGFLVGNDFIPNLPNLHINTGALPLLYEVYMEVLPKMSGYINNHGELHLERFEVFMTALSVKDKDMFHSHQMDFKLFAAENDSLLTESLGDANQITDFDFLEMVTNSAALAISDDESSLSESEMMERDFYRHREAYYQEKMHYKEMNENVRREQTECYITAIQWNLYYYYRGVSSWSWFYPHHYAPFITDICKFKDLKIQFEMGKPFLPFQQLLSVLPAASSELLPEAYRPLMTDSNSKLSHYYPLDFATDLNGKKQEWEAVVLIPFIDEKLLLEEMSKCDSKLKLNEKARNIHSPMHSYKYTNVNQGSCEGPFDLINISNVYCSEEKIQMDGVKVPVEKAVMKRSHDSKLFYPGFPTLKHLKYSGSVRNVKVNVFDQPSRNDSMIIKIEGNDIQESGAENLAKSLIGTTVYVNWPFLTEARVVKVSDSCNMYYLDDANQLQSTNNERWRYDSQTITQHHMNRMGIDVGKINSIVHVVTRLGMEYVYKDGNYVLRKTYSNHEVAFASQSIIQNILLAFKQYENSIKPIDVFEVGTPIIMTASPFFGCFGEVIDISLLKKSSRIKVALTISEDPFLKNSKDTHFSMQRKYLNPISAALELGITELALLKLTDGIYYVDGQRQDTIEVGTHKRNIALQLKSKKNNEVVFGYTKKINKVWLYSEKAVELVREYIEQFPELLRVVEEGNSLVFETDFKQGFVTKVLEWLKSKKIDKFQLSSATSDVAEKESVMQIIDSLKASKNKSLRRVLLQIKPTAVHVPHLNMCNQAIQENIRYRLFDRVVVSTKDEKAALGQKGTVIAVHHITDKNPVRQGNLNKADTFCDVLFDKSFNGGLPYFEYNENCVARISKAHLLNISCTRETETKTSLDAPTPLLAENIFKEDKRTASTSKIQQIQSSVQTSDVKTQQNQVLNSLWESLKSIKKNATESSIQIPSRVPVVSSNSKTSDIAKDDQASNALKAILGINKDLVETPALLPPPPPESWKVSNVPRKPMHATPFIPLQVMRNAADINSTVEAPVINKVSSASRPSSVIQPKVANNGNVDKNTTNQMQPQRRTGGPQKRKRRIAANFKNA